MCRQADYRLGRRNQWLFDKFIGGMALLAASPIMLLTALAIKLDSRGPVFFKQKRYGFNNELMRSQVPLDVRRQMRRDRVTTLMSDRRSAASSHTHALR